MKQSFFLSMIVFIAISSIAIAQENKPEVTPSKETETVADQKNGSSSDLGWLIWFTKYKDLTSFIFGIAALVLAFFGYNGWRKQLRVKERYELARRILKLVYQVEESIKVIRRPIRSGSRESLVTLFRVGNESINQAVVSEYQRMKEDLSHLIPDLKTESLERPKVLGAEGRKKIKLLEKYVDELKHDIQELSAYTKTREYHDVKECQIDAIKRLLKTIHQAEENDDFATKVDKAVKGIESYFRPHLNLESRGFFTKLWGKLSHIKSCIRGSLKGK